MKKVIRLTESDLVRLINRVISEQSTEGRIQSTPQQELFTPQEIKMNAQKNQKILGMLLEINNMFKTSNCMIVESYCEFHFSPLFHI